MTNTTFNKLVMAAMGGLIALTTPSAAGWFAWQYTGNAILGAVAGIGVVYQLMALSVAMLSLYEYIPESLPLGPSYMAGHGLLTLAMTAAPAVTLPGLAWLWLLPFDAQGYFKSSAVAGLELRDIERPHHDKGGVAE